MSLVDLRREVQRIDEEIIWLIAERVGLAEKIFEIKKAEGIKIEDPDQETLVMNRVLDLATELNVDAGAIKEIIHLLIKMSLDKQHECLGEDNLP